MANHARGLWGYSGTTAAGRGLTVQATGMGGPSAALVLSDLAELGVERAVRVGTCAAIDPEFRPGDLVWVRAARPWSADRPGAGSPARPDEALAESLRTELGEEARAGRVASVDFLHPSPDPAHSIPEGDVADMQTAALLHGGRAAWGRPGGGPHRHRRRRIGAPLGRGCSSSGFAGRRGCEP